MTNVAKEEQYEDVRDAYSDDINKNFTVLAEKHLHALKQKVKNLGLVSLDDRELVRINLYIEDMQDHLPKQDGDEFEYWLIQNMDRNPGYFNKYFRKLPTKDPSLSLIKTAKVEIPMTEEVQTSSAIVEDVKVEEVKIPEPLESILADYNDENFHIEGRVLPDTSGKISEEAILEVVDEIQQSKKKEMERKLREIISQITNVNLSSKETVMATVAEASAYKSAITTMLSLLDISVDTTSFEKGVNTKTVTFYADREYSLSEINKGMYMAKMKILELVKNGDEIKEKSIALRESEGKLKSVQGQNSELTDKLIKTQQELNKQNTKAKIEDTQFMYCYIAWDEKDEDGTKTTYYLTSTSKDHTITNHYPIMSLQKTQSLKEAIKYKSRELAIQQIEKANQFFPKIKKEAKISVKEHLNKSYLVEYLKNKNGKYLPHAKVVNA